MVEGKMLREVKKQTKKKKSVSLSVKKNKTLQLQCRHTSLMGYLSVETPFVCLQQTQINEQV